MGFERIEAYAPPTCSGQMAIAGLHGRKSGRGFYVYEAR